MEAVESRIITSCILNTPWCRVDIFLTPETWVTPALTDDQLLGSNLIYG